MTSLFCHWEQDYVIASKMPNSVKYTTVLHTLRKKILCQLNYDTPSVIRNIIISEILRSKLWCWRKLLRVPWTARRSNQSILKEISPEYALEGLMLKLKLWYFGHLMWRTDSLEKTWMLGKTEGRRRRGRQRMRWFWDGWMASPTWWTWVSASSRGWWWTGKPGVLQSMGSQRAGHDWATELNWKSEKSFNGSINSDQEYSLRDWPCHHNCELDPPLGPYTLFPFSL